VLKWIKRLLTFCGVICALLVILGYLFAESLLFVESPCVKADAFVVLGGDSADRPWKLVELFKRGIAQKVIVSGQGDCELIQQRLMYAGVPNECLIGDPVSKNTKENAEISVALLRTLGAKRVVIVTSWYHSRRALACFHHYAPEIEFRSMPSYNGVSMDKKPGIGEAFYVFAEYAKFCVYGVRYGIWPWDVGARDHGTT
jgi:uncharacterized SAM-binding protein YcdF (DUF218 family)